jgi:mono/diheme cytochrome c family protein
MVQRNLAGSQYFLPLSRAFMAVALLALVCSLGAQDQPAPVKPWVAPADARAVKNPVPVTPAGLAEAANLFKDNCVMCHGEKGMGDGESAKTLNRKPANFTDKAMMSQETDGALFWKMSQGRSPMPSWEDVFSDTQRWELVNYLRQLTKNASAGK